MITGFYHTGFVVRDLEAMTAFYRDVLGLAVQWELDLEGEYISQVVGFPGAHVRLAYLGKEGEKHRLELIQYLNPPGRDGHNSTNALGASHLCFYVDDVERMYRELNGRGLRFVNPPALRQYAGRGTFKVCYCQDPEGNWLELLEVSE